jgi:ribose transport system ATP-binding protein
MPTPKLELTSIYKKFPGVIALKNVNISIFTGEVHAIVGANGAGKSTLVKILSGIFNDYQGNIWIDGKNIELRNPRSSLKHGISYISQEFCLIDGFTVSENIFLGLKTSKTNVFLNHKNIIKKTLELCENVDFHIEPNVYVNTLNVAQKQITEILKALNRNAEVIIMDEPTASLTAEESSILFKTIRKLQESGISFIFITHKLEDVFKIANRITVLRDGEVVFTKMCSECNVLDLQFAMMGLKLTNFKISKTKTFNKEPLIDIVNVSYYTLRNISLQIYPGEIVGISCRIYEDVTDLFGLIYKNNKHLVGRINFKNEPHHISNPQDAIAKGIGFLGADRLKESVFPIMTVKQNISILIINILALFGIINLFKERKLVQSFINKLSIKTYSLNQHISTLSGGNQQKSIIARWLLKDPKLLIIEEPTRGIDISGKAEVYQIIAEMREQNRTCIIYSSDLDELILLSDRVVTLENGTLESYVYEK